MAGSCQLPWRKSLASIPTLAKLQNTGQDWTVGIGFAGWDIGIRPLSSPTIIYEKIIEAVKQCFLFQFPQGMRPRVILLPSLTLRPLMQNERVGLTQQCPVETWCWPYMINTFLVTRLKKYKMNIIECNIDNILFQHTTNINILLKCFVQEVWNLDNFVPATPDNSVTFQGLNITIWC